MIAMPWPKPVFITRARPQSLGQIGRVRSLISIRGASWKPSARNAACIRATPIVSATWAVAMLELWTISSGIVIIRPSG